FGKALVMEVRRTPRSPLITDESRTGPEVPHLFRAVILPSGCLPGPELSGSGGRIRRDLTVRLCPLGSACAPAPEFVRPPDDQREAREHEQLPRAEGRGLKDRLHRRGVDDQRGEREREGDAAEQVP